MGRLRMRNLDPCHRRAWAKDSTGKGVAVIVPKAVYRTEDEAAAMATQLNQSAYRCPKCRCYHLTARATP